MLETITAATTEDLTTLDNAKAEIGLTGSSSDPDVLALIRQASAACARYCGRPGFGRERVKQSRRAWYAADAGPIALVRDLDPAIVTVTHNGTDLDPAEYVLSGGFLHLATAYGSQYCGGWVWFGDVAITYDAGFDLLGSLPDDIERACLATVRAWWFGRGRDPGVRQMQTEGVGLTSYFPVASVTGALPTEAEALLNPWRRFGGF